MSQELTTPLLAKTFLNPELAGELLASYGSPLYVYQEASLRQTIRQITQAIDYSKTGFHFASVTNGNVALLQIFEQEGWGLHANTPGDIYLGLKAGFAPDRIVYSGSNLRSEEIQQAFSWGIGTFNLDSLSQVQLVCQVYRESTESRGKTHDRKIRLGLRLNIPELTGESRIGVRPEAFPEAVAIAASAGLKINGLHFYRGTGTNATKAFTQAIETVIATAQQLPDWNYLDFGGGFGYPYRAGDLVFDWKLLGQELSQHLQKVDRAIELIVEPGRAAIAGCAVLLTRVISLKWQDNKQIAGVDSSIANLAVLSVHGGYREIMALQPEIASAVESSGEINPPDLYVTDVCGNTTYSRDYLGKNCQLPALKEGDILAILDVGAYGYAMSSHFLHRPRPAEVLLGTEGPRLIRQREDYSVLLHNQVF